MVAVWPALASEARPALPPQPKLGVLAGNKTQPRHRPYHGQPEADATKTGAEGGFGGPEQE